MLMRTTLNIDDGLGREAKRRAAEQGITLTAVIEGALRDAFARQAPKPRLELPLDPGGSGPAPGVDLSDNRRLRDILDGLD